ncbi:SDR family oxidoreductase [Streptomyces sp. TRM 70351]|uniref:SDR family oxidoreductase n=1 Tax=Streptomyces sp. TRM 70351 TaxID=3116552 RepID=UPI002E7ACECB|nr:SDR family oxidoreductase [Streptomyces sp. TRM 70351]MEE1928820.1 SDR family oxidoreductase [Streptomyces sp. TRM 70351]
MANDGVVLVTGAGFRSAEGLNETENIYTSRSCKPNIGACVALEVAMTGRSVVIASSSEAKLSRVRQSILDMCGSAKVSISPVDLSDPSSVQRMVDGIPEGRHVDVVHSAGLGAANYKIPDDNPYLPVERTPIGFPAQEFDAVVTTLLLLVQKIIPRIAGQERTRLIVIGSMSGIRAYPFGYSHASAKAGLHHAVRTLALELNQRGIHVTEVNPGVVDTGLYDNPAVARASAAASKAFGYAFEGDRIPQMPPREVGRAVAYTLNSAAHVLTINLVPFGQEPHTGS